MTINIKADKSNMGFLLDNSTKFRKFIDELDIVDELNLDLRDVGTEEEIKVEEVVKEVKVEEIVKVEEEVKEVKVEEVVKVEEEVEVEEEIKVEEEVEEEEVKEEVKEGFKDVKEVMKTLTRIKGADTAKAILQSFGATQLSFLDEGYYEEIINMVRKELE